MTAGIRKLLQSIDGENEKNNDYLESCLGALVENDVPIDAEDVNLMLQCFLIKSCTTSLLLNVIADSARNEDNRSVLTTEELFKKIISYISSDDPKVVLQSLRCLCNICAENDQARSLFSSLHGVKELLDKSKKILKSENGSDWNEVICPACSCIQNIVADSDSLLEEFLDENALTILAEYLVNFYKSDEKISCAVLNGIASLADSDKGIQVMGDSGTMKQILELVPNFSDELIKVLFTSILTDYGSKENARLLLSKSGCLKFILDTAEKRPNYMESSCTDPILKMMADLTVLLTSGEESFDVLVREERDMLQTFSKWIESPNRHIQVTAGLALGNYARSDQTCAELVSNKIHENMINVIKENINDENYADRFEAYASCLRNLSIPVTNKTTLIEAGLPNVASDLIKKSGLPVQFKALAVLRLLVEGNSDLACKLLNDSILLGKVCELAETSVVTSVPSEAQRLSAALVKYGNAEEPIRIALSCGCLQPINKLLSSDHPLMRNEGLIGFIIILANVSDCLPKLKEVETLPKVITLLKENEAQAQTLFNALTFIQALASVVGGKTHLEEFNMKDTLQSIQSHSEEIISNKVTETLDILN